MTFVKGFSTKQPRLSPTGDRHSRDDVAEVVVLAASNRNITGSVIETDGGESGLDDLKYIAFCRPWEVESSS